MKKFRFAIIAIILLISISTNVSANSIYSTYNIPFEDMTYSQNSGEDVVVLIEMDDLPIIEKYNVQNSTDREGVLYSQTAQEYGLDIISKQESIVSILEHQGTDVQKRFNLTTLANAFSITIKESELPKLQNLSGVKSITRLEPISSPTLTANSTKMQSIPSLMNNEITDYHNNNIKGQGTAIAIVDTGVDYNHEYLTLSDLGKENAKYTQETIEQKIDSIQLLSSVYVDYSSSDVYKNDKVPFAFDYGDFDCDPMDSHTHGTHVAGIAAGNNSNSSQDSINGIAPEAQIIAMKISSTSDGSAYTDSILAAYEDAVMLGVDVINFSFGSDFGSDTISYYDDVLENIKNAGILYYTSSGNSDKFDYNNNSLPQNIDYSSVGSPSTLKNAFSIASANTLPVGYSDNGNYDVSYFSAYGPTPKLSLKPEILGFGGYILSSTPDNKYANSSGTSMSTPHLSGIGALFKQATSQNTSLTGEDFVSYAKNLFMSTAIPMKQNDTTYFSPKRQGAGMVSLSSILNTELVLSNAKTQETKIELGDNIQNITSLDFEVTNLTSKDLEYSIMATAQTDIASSLDKSQNLNLASITVKEITTDKTSQDISSISQNNLNQNNQNFSETTISLKANTTTTISLKLDISKHIDSLNSQFVNGFYLDGFIRLLPIDKNSGVEVSIPYLGFVGNFSNPPIFDDFLYQDSCVFGVQSLTTKVMGEEQKIGVNYINDAIKAYDYIAFSPNLDGNGDLLYPTMTLLRNTNSVTFEIFDSANVCVYKKDMPSQSKTEETDFLEYAWTGITSSGQRASQGDYRMRVSAELEFDNSIQSISLPFTIDTTLPTFQSATIAKNSNSSLLKVSAQDNHYVQFYELIFDNSNTFRSVDGVFNLSDFDYKGKKAALNIIDYAYNQKTVVLEFLDDDTIIPANSLPDFINDFKHGSGTKDDPYLIENLSEFLAMSKYLGPNYIDTYFKLADGADISLSSDHFISIGYCADHGAQDASHSSCRHFMANFDGNKQNNASISIKDIQPQTNISGFTIFKALEGTVQNLAINVDDDSNIVANSLNLLCTYNYGKIIDCDINITQSVLSFDTFSAIASINHGLIKDCNVNFASSRIFVEQSLHGVCALNYGTVENINLNSSSCIFFGTAYEQSAEYAKISAVSLFNYGAISNVSSNIRAENMGVFGVAGVNEGDISNVESTLFALNCASVAGVAHASVDNSTITNAGAVIKADYSSNVSGLVYIAENCEVNSSFVDMNSSFSTITSGFAQSSLNSSFTDCFAWIDANSADNFASLVYNMENSAAKQCYVYQNVDQPTIKNASYTAIEFDNATLQNVYISHFSSDETSTSIGELGEKIVPHSSLSSIDTFAGFDFDKIWLFEDKTISNNLSSTLPVLQNLGRCSFEKHTNIAKAYVLEDDHSKVYLADSSGYMIVGVSFTAVKTTDEGILLSFGDGIGDNLLDVTFKDEVVAQFSKSGRASGGDDVSIADVVAVLRYITGISGEINLACADVTRDGDIAISDVVELLKYITKLPLDEGVFIPN